MSKIVKIIGREILDSRGIPTVESEVHLECGIMGLSSVPSGASTGSKEAIEIRDGDISRFFGKGVKKSVNIINNIISKSLIGKDVTEQFYLDQIMIDLDGTENKSNLGSNSILSVSLSLAKAASTFKKMNLYEYISELYGNYGNFSMPLPMINIINGGKHADNNLDFQEFMIQPVGAKTIKEAIQMGSEIFHSLSKVLKQKNMNTNVGDEGGYAPDLKSNVHALDIIQESVEKSGYIFGKDVTIAIDCASSEFFDRSQNLYHLRSEKKSFHSIEFIEYLENLVKHYPISSIEDGLSEFDWENCVKLQNILGEKIQLVGDDIFVTNSKILKKGIQMGILNAILVKFNQIGSLTETLSTVSLAKKSNYKVIISHRSGETEDTTISDLSVGVSANQIKTGSMSRSERIAKYNQLLRIEEKIRENICYSWR